MCSFTRVPSASAPAMIASIATGRAHLLGREVGVGTGAVPVALDGLRVEAHVHAELLGDALEQPARRPEMIAHRDGIEHADLELPLRHHHFGVRALDARCPHACTRACALRRCHDRASSSRRRRSSRGPGARGSRLRASRRDGRLGRTCTPARCRTWARRPRYFFAISTARARVLVTCGVMSGFRTSHITSTSLGPRSGLGQENTGSSTQSE